MSTTSNAALWSRYALPTSSKSYRWDSNPNTKLDDRFEFPFDIDLDEFLDDTADRTRPWKYQLHTVLAHSGDLHNGRHFALIKPSPHTRWLKFDDERVTPVTDREVLEENYDGDPLNGTIPQTQGNQIKAMKGIASAHTLVYIREIAINEVLAPLVQEDVPPHLGESTLD